jgi:hypothetical protein
MESRGGATLISRYNENILKGRETARIILPGGGLSSTINKIKRLKDQGLMVKDSNGT